MLSLFALPARTKGGGFRVVVETPRGCGVKLKLDPELGCFEYGRALVLGLSYPFDWGFIPSTKAADGDPLDAMVLHDAPTYPGVVIECRALGVVLVDEPKERGRGRQRNDRIIAVPLRGKRAAEVDHANGLARPMRQELQQFFESAVLFEKPAQVIGWKGARQAEELIEQSMRAYVERSE